MNNKLLVRSVKLEF